MRAEWKCVSTISGALCAMICGTTVMHRLSADSWASLGKVSVSFNRSFTFLPLFIY